MAKGKKVVDPFSFKESLKYSPKSKNYRDIIYGLQRSIRKKQSLELWLYYSLLSMDILAVVLISIFISLGTAMIVGLCLMIAPIVISQLVERDILKLYNDLIDLIHLDSLMEDASSLLENQLNWTELSEEAEGKKESVPTKNKKVIIKAKPEKPSELTTMIQKIKKKKSDK